MNATVRKFSFDANGTTIGIIHSSQFTYFIGEGSGGGKGELVAVI